jgi:large subunit ribosomal protein L29
MNDQDLSDKLAESKGTLKKQSGSIRWLRRDIARMKTIMNERKAQK